ncbi:phage portal protein [Dokdonella sp.]|uniref:phage portal protein n=1 Tax=Dokdonella sp. TaxID=2291710 RepID=UPI0026077BBA|nr:phage portal protein [Dokdonella sp.]
MGTALAAVSRLQDVVAHDRAHAQAAVVPSANAGDVQETRWRGASRALRTLQNWHAAIGSATSDLPSTERRTLRARSRDAFRNNLIGRAALTRCRTNIVGAGLICRPNVDAKALGLSADAAEALNAQLLASWEQWAESPIECDQEATLDFYGLQALALLSGMASGDVFGITPSQRRPGCTFGLKVQLVEADRVGNPNDAPDTTSCIDGVELRDGMPVGYWVRDTHPGDTQSLRISTWTYYAAFGEATGRRRVLHIWNDKDRPGQVRGAPYLAPILEPLKQLDRYGGAELMAAVISAMFTVFIKRSPEAAGDGDPFDVDAQGQMQLGNAAIVGLGVGEEPEFANPSRPNANFDPFFVAVVKQIGAALELPLDELLLHYNASYSAARAAMLQAWRFYTQRRWLLTQQFCAPVYGLFLDEQVASGRLALPGYSDPIRRAAYTRALWIGPARGSMDEEKEANAARTRIEIGVSNEAVETAAMTGEDHQSVYQQRVREINQRKADGIYYPPRDVRGGAQVADNAPPARESTGGTL